MTKQTKEGLGWWLLVALLVFGMKASGEFYPFSSFPMYSNLGDDAVVLFVRMVDGTPLPLLEVFGKRESRCKKIWKSELREITNAAGRHSQEATSSEIAEAGEYLLEKLLTERYHGRLEEFGSGDLELFLRRITLADGRLVEDETRIATTSW